MVVATVVIVVVLIKGENPIIEFPALLPPQVFMLF